MNKLMTAKEWGAYCTKIYAANKWLLESVMREELDWNGKPVQKTPERKNIKTAQKVCK